MAENGNVKIKVTNLSRANLKIGKCLLKYAFSRNFITSWFWLACSYYWRVIKWYQNLTK